MNNTLPKSPFVNSYPIAFKHDILIEGVLDSVEFFMEEINTIKTASPDDIVEITINSPGGDPDVAKLIIDAIEQCPAYVYIKAGTKVASAATFIFLAEVNEYIIDADTEFLFHQPSYRLGSGKHSDTKSYVEHSDKVCDRMYNRYYKGFLPDELIQKISEGYECFMFGDEVLELLQARSERLQKDTELSESENLEEKPLTEES